jgi:2-phosphosulfolactate phosphatase
VTGIRFDWGAAGARAANGPAGSGGGARAANGPAGALVVVDVLSFSTAVTIAAGRGTAVYPHPWPSPDVESFATEHDAVWAVRRREVTGSHPWSLSPAHLVAAPAPGRLVLPSPNGSAIAAASTGCVLAGCLRNATAVARWLEEHGFGTRERPVTVIAAGERWPGGELRPALEDLMGAAAIIAAFGAQRVRSPEASVTEAVWAAHHDHAAELLLESFSGRELAGHGFTDDVTLAAEHDAQRSVPLLTGGAFQAAAP